MELLNLGIFELFVCETNFYKKFCLMPGMVWLACLKTDSVHHWQPSHCTAKDSAWHHAAIRLLVEFAFRRQTTVVGYILIFFFFFNIFLQRVHSFRIGKMNTDRLIMPQNVCIVQMYIRMSTMKPKWLWNQIWWYDRMQQFFFNRTNLILILWEKSGIIRFEFKTI